MKTRIGGVKVDVQALTDIQLRNLKLYTQERALKAAEEHQLLCEEESRRLSGQLELADQMGVGVCTHDSRGVGSSSPAA